MQVDTDKAIPRIIMDTSVLPQEEQFGYWAAHTRGAHLSQPVPGPFYCKGDLWNLGEVQATIVDCDPFEALRDRALINAVAADYIQFNQLLEGVVTFEADGATAELTPPTSYVRDAAQPSYVTATRIRLLILYFSRSFLEEVTGPIDYQGALAPVPELALLRKVATAMIDSFPTLSVSSAPLFATILRDLTGAAMLRARASQRVGHPSALSRAKSYIAEQPAGTVSVDGLTAALGLSRSAIYRLFAREGGPLAYDRLRRLRAVHRGLSNPLNVSTLSELAVRYGFRDDAALARSFRKAFGYPPSETRERLVDAPSPTTDTAPGQIRQAFDAID